MTTRVVITLCHTVYHDTLLDESEIKDQVMEDYGDMAYEIESIQVGVTVDRQIGEVT